MFKRRRRLSVGSVEAGESESLKSSAKAECLASQGCGEGPWLMETVFVSGMRRKSEARGEVWGLGDTVDDGSDG